LREVFDEAFREVFDGFREDLADFADLDDLADFVDLLDLEPFGAAGTVSTASESATTRARSNVYGVRLYSMTGK
jgi:hypothetical protein